MPRNDRGSSAGFDRFTYSFVAWQDQSDIEVVQRQAFMTRQIFEPAARARASLAYHPGDGAKIEPTRSIDRQRWVIRGNHKYELVLVDPLPRERRVLCRTFN